MGFLLMYIHRESTDSLVPRFPPSAPNVTCMTFEPVSEKRMKGEPGMCSALVKFSTACYIREYNYVCVVKNSTPQSGTDWQRACL